MKWNDLSTLGEKVAEGKCRQACSLVHDCSMARPVIIQQFYMEFLAGALHTLSREYDTIDCGMEGMHCQSNRKHTRSLNPWPPCHAMLNCIVLIAIGTGNWKLLQKDM